MELLHIVYGFDKPDVIKKIESELKKLGYEVEGTVRYTYLSIKQFMEENTEYNILIVPEKDEASADELATIADLRDINIITVVNRYHYGTNFMYTLYAAGITNALFQEKARKGAKPKEIAALCIEKRNRKIAREYYGISNDGLLTTLSMSEVNSYIETLYDETYGADLGERFLKMASKLSPLQVEDFLKKISSELRDELAEYEDFYTVISALKEAGIKYKVKNQRKNLIKSSINFVPREVNMESSLLEEEKVELECSERNLFSMDKDAVSQEEIANKEVTQEIIALPEKSFEELFSMSDLDCYDEEEEYAPEEVYVPIEEEKTDSLEEVLKPKKQKKEKKKIVFFDKAQKDANTKQKVKKTEQENSKESKKIVQDNDDDNEFHKIIPFLVCVGTLLFLIIFVLGISVIGYQSKLKKQAQAEAYELEQTKKTILASQDTVDNQTSISSNQVAEKEKPLVEENKEKKLEVMDVSIITQKPGSEIATTVVTKKPNDSVSTVASVKDKSVTEPTVPNTTPTNTTNTETVASGYDYTYVPVEKETLFSNVSIPTGSTVTGVFVINTINANKGNYKVIATTGTFTYTNGNATIKDIPAKSNFTVSGTGTDLIFTEVS